jgi:hypothetical protein
MLNSRVLRARPRCEHVGCSEDGEVWRFYGNHATADDCRAWEEARRDAWLQLRLRSR